MRWVFLVVTAVLSLWARPAAPQTAPIRIAMPDALELGASRGPGVGVARAPRTAVAGLGEHASRLLRPPVLTVGGGYRFGGLAPGTELSLSVSQEVPVLGVGAARSGLAKAQTHALETDVRRARLDGAARGALAWVGAMLAKEVLTLREQGLAQAEAIGRTSESRVQAGVASPQELALVQGEVAAARASVQDAEGAEVEAFAELRFAIGAGADTRLEAVGELYGADEVAVDEGRALRAAEGGNATLLLAQARAEQARSETVLTAAMLGPSVVVGATFLREGTGDKVLLGFVGLPLPLFDAAGFETSRQLAAQKGAEAQLGLARAELARDVRLALHDRHHWREVRDTLQSRALVAYSEAFRIAQTQYQVGSGEVGAVILARQRLLSVQERLAELAARVRCADITLAHTTGALLDEVQQ